MKSEEIKSLAGKYRPVLVSPVVRRVYAREFRQRRVPIRDVDQRGAHCSPHRGGDEPARDKRRRSRPPVERRALAPEKRVVRSVA